MVKIVMFMPPFRIYLAVAALAATAPVQATQFLPNVSVISDSITYDVRNDGTYAMDEIIRYRLNTDQAVKNRSQLPLSYSASLQELNISEAYTTTKDGKRIDVTPDRILLQQSPQSHGAPMFDDAKIKTVVFPGVDVGSVLTAHLQRNQKKALFPGEFSILEIAGSKDEYLSEDITIRAPESLKLYVDAEGMQGGPLDSHDPGIQLWHWSIKAAQAQVPEMYSVDEIDRSPRLAVTTFSSYEAAGVAYLERALPQARVTPAIVELANRITVDLVDKRDQAEAIYRWVSENIRYVAVVLDFGGVVPHDAQAIVEAKYGDCKDHVTVLEALLAAKGIQSSPVLVNSGSVYWSPKVASVPGVFNHVITYLPAYKTYLDSTSGLAMFGVTPTTGGKQALITDDGTGHPKLVALPIDSPEKDGVKITTDMYIESDGTARGSSEIRSGGLYDWISRQVFASLQPGTESQIAGQMLSMAGQTGVGSYQHGDMRDLSRSFSYSTEFQLPNYAQLPGHGAFAVPEGLNGFNNFLTALEKFSAEKREFALPYGGRHISETISIRLPEGIRLTSLPMAANIQTPFASYTSNYSVTGRLITVTRDLRIQLKTALIQPEEYPAFRAMALAVRRDLRSQLVY